MPNGSVASNRCVTRDIGKASKGNSHEAGGKLVLGAVIVGTLSGGKDPSMIPFGGIVMGGIETGGVVSMGVPSGGAAEPTRRQ
jgi:hypothetical protein